MHIRTCLMAVAAAASSPAAHAADDGALRACRAIPELAARAACYDAIPLPALPAPPAAPPADPVARFGASQIPTPVRDELEAITSRIPGPFEGWDANTRWTLANGQVWAIADGSRAVYRLKDPSVQITRGVSGTFFIEIEGVSRMPRVKRLQ